MKWTGGPGGKGFHKGEMGAKTFPKVESPGMAGHKGEFPKGFAPGGMSPKVRDRLKSMGMSQMGVQQLAAGQMPTAPGDRKLVTSIVNSALNG